MKKKKKKLSVILHISGILIYGAHVLTDNISKHFFHFFKILFFQVFRVEKGQKSGPKWQKFCSSFSISDESQIMQLSFMIHMCKMIISPVFIFCFFKISIYVVVREGKVVQNDKKLCLSHSISQEPYIIWSSYNHTYNHTSLGIFLYFQNIDFRVFRGVKWQKIFQNDKNSICHALYLRNCSSYHQDFWYTGVK